MRKTLIFGNGLGMSVAKEAFSLNGALERAWSNPSLGASQKALILACLPEDTKLPNAEEDMGELQNIVAACETIMRLQRSANVTHWLTDEGISFPEAVYRYVFETAVEMYNAVYLSGVQVGVSCGLPDSFSEPLAAFVRDSRSHVATLNYDGLLSKKFREHGVFDSANGTLTDGFSDNVFRREHLFRQDTDAAAWYLHLHGCPLFSDEKFSGDIKKLSELSLQGKRRLNLKRVGRHIVLSHARNKPAIIGGSYILKSYWEFFDRSLSESQEIVVFGYSGNDPHLNQLIAQKREAKNVRVIEWLGAGPEAQRQEYWTRQLGGAIHLHSMESPLSFADW